MSRGGEADLGVHVGAVHVDEPAVVVDDAADILDAFFKDAVGRRIGHHHAGRASRFVAGFFFQVRDIDVALRIGLTGTTLFPR